MLDQQVPVLGLHVTLSSLARPREPHPEITGSGLEAETKAACDHSDIQAACSASWVPCEMTQRTMDTKTCVARKVRLAVKNGISRSWCAQVSRVLLPCVPRLPRTQLKEKSSTQDSGTYLQLLRLGWLHYHSNRPGRSCLNNVYVPDALIQLWHHNQVCPDWSDHVSTASTAPLPPVSSHLGGSFLARTSDLRIAFLLHVPSSHHSRFNWHGISVLFQTTPNLDRSLWRTRRLSAGEYTNTSSPLKVNQPGKLPEPGMRQLQAHDYISHHLGGDSLIWHKISQTENLGLSSSLYCS
jgi:hypothetical protein